MVVFHGLSAYRHLEEQLRQAHLQQVLTAVQRGAAVVQHTLAFSRQTPVERTPSR